MTITDVNFPIYNPPKSTAFMENSELATEYRHGNFGEYPDRTEPTELFHSEILLK